MKTLHANSAAAYSDGRIDQFPKRTAAIVRALRAARGPLTDREVMVALGFQDPNSCRPRITELIDAGVAEEIDSVRCPVTGKTVRRVKLVRREAQAEFDLGAVLTPAVVEQLNRRAS